MTQTSTMGSRFFFWLGFLCGVAMLAFAIKEAPYYILSSADQALHAHDNFLRSSGYGGLSFGVIGTVLIFFNLGYLVRRAVLHITWLGPLRSWMSFHVFTGMVGGGLILFHSVFHPRSTLGVLAFTGLLVTLITGIVGRYIYSRVPRSIEGKELELDDIGRQLKELETRLQSMGFRQSLVTNLPENRRESLGSQNMLSHFTGLVSGSRDMKIEFSMLKQAVLQSPQLKLHAKTILPLVKRYVETHQWFIRYHELRSLMGSWRFFHRWFAILMLVTILFHILVAIQMGDLWLFKK